MKNIKPIILNSLWTLVTLTVFYPFGAQAQTDSFAQDIKVISDILVNQGEIHRTALILTDVQISDSLTYPVVSMTSCTLTTDFHTDSHSYSPSIGHNHEVDTYEFSYNPMNITDISIIPTGNTDQYGFNYQEPAFHVIVKLNTDINMVRTFHESTMTADSKGKPLPQMNYYIKSEENAKKMVETLNHLAQLCGAPKPAAKQNAEDLPDEEQAHYKQVLIHGKPALMYSTALDMADEGHTNLALQMLQALIEKYPDDAYAAKAIDKKEALRSQIKKSPLSGIRQSAPISSSNLNNGANNINNNDKLQKVQACQSSCQTTKNSCDMTYSNNMGPQLGNTINGLRGHNSAAAQQAGSQILGDPNACQNEYDACTTRCGG